MLAVALVASAFAQTPKALGWERGQAVPQSAIIEHATAEGPWKIAPVESVAGFDVVAVVYTDKLGVCGVGGVEWITSNNAYGTVHRRKVDDWAERVASKFDGVAGTKTDANIDTLFDKARHWLTALKRGNVVYRYSWRDSLPEGYSYVEVVAAADHVAVSFRFDNYDACRAEKEAAQRAEL